jgi:monoamine oxidase
MARTLLADRLRHITSIAHEASERNVDVEQIFEERRNRSTSRREFLRTAGAGLAGAALAIHARPARAAEPRIVVVGAGLAGLTAAYRLKQAGYTAQIYEASDRVGGRCWTLRGAFDDGQIVEHGGELIDQGHTAIRHLAHELGLTLDNLLQAEVNGTEPFYYFDGEPYTSAQAASDTKHVWQKIHSDVSAASYPTTYDSHTRRGWELDHMSIIDWINESIPGGMNSNLGQLLDIAYNIEYGGESSVQSSLNLLYLLGSRGQGKLRIFGESNEKYHVRGGNDQISQGMADELAGQIHTGSELVAIKKNSDNTYTLTFESGSATRTVTADRVVMAIPFSILRSSVDCSEAGFKPLKVTAIREMGMGTNSKMHVQFTARHWNDLGCNGDTFADTGYQNTWEVSRVQPGTSGILVNYTGGNVSASFGSGTPTSHAQQFLSQLEPVLPGISAHWNGKATIDYWQGQKWAKGSYSYWKVGQYTKFAGVEGKAEGGVHFCGEHTSIDFQGYLNGAVETGERAAAEILAAYR